MVYVFNNVNIWTSLFLDGHLHTWQGLKTVQIINLLESDRDTLNNAVPERSKYMWPKVLGCILVGDMEARCESSKCHFLKRLSQLGWQVSARPPADSKISRWIFRVWGKKERIINALKECCLLILLECLCNKLSYLLTYSFLSLWYKSQALQLRHSKERRF